MCIRDSSEIKHDIRADYKAMIIEKINIARPMKVVMDCGNAAGSLNAPEIFKDLGI